MIPQRDCQLVQHRERPLHFDRDAHRQRSIIERRIGWLKKCRRLATRFEKPAVNFIAMVKAAIVERYLKPAFSD